VQAATIVFDRIAKIVLKWQNGSLPEYELDVLNSLVLQDLLPTSMDQSTALSVAVTRFRKLALAVPKPVYARSIVDGHGEDEAVYVRGNHKTMTPERAPRRFLTAAATNVFSQPGSGRRQWADALVHPNNTLTSRVMVNRVWAHLFGRGLVATVDNFGAMGERPTHPELLDHLSYRFIRDGWSLKRLIRKLVLSNTYRLSTQPVVRSKRVDPLNQWLSHMPVRRLPAEAIRDSILAVSGRLQHHMFGPSVPISLKTVTASRARPRKDGPLDGAGRRSVYQEIRRNYLPGFLRAFDLPNASVTFGQRAVTNVPTQALALMNDPFVIQQTSVWAKQVVGMNASFKSRINHLHLSAYSRPATRREQSRFRKILNSLTSQLKVRPSELNDLRVWQAICHIMIGRKEFIFLIGDP